MSMLELRRVSKAYGQGTAEAHALVDVSLPVDEGSMVAMMGPNGPDKRTLARMLAPRDPQPQQAEAAVMRAQRIVNEPRCRHAYSALCAIILYLAKIRWLL